MVAGKFFVTPVGFDNFKILDKNSGLRSGSLCC